MAQPYIGEIRMFAGNFAPAGWAFCDGQLMPISENDALFTLIGTTYGGDGQSTFGLPNLQSRVPIHFGTGGGGTYQQGEMAGVESVTLTTNQIASHNHSILVATTPGSTNVPASNVVLSTEAEGNPNAAPVYSATVTNTLNLAAQALGATGGNQPHNNIQPTLTISYIISLFGVFPSQT
jgi:microcystin-dependent protein